MTNHTVKWERNIGRSGPDGVLFRADVTLTITLATGTYDTGGLALGASAGGKLRQAGLGNVRNVSGFSGWAVLPSGAYLPAVFSLADPVNPKLILLTSTNNGLTFEQLANTSPLGSGTVTLKLFAHGDMA